MNVKLYMGLYVFIYIRKMGRAERIHVWCLRRLKKKKKKKKRESLLLLLSYDNDQ